MNNKYHAKKIDLVLEEFNTSKKFHSLLKFLVKKQKIH